jgi:hypothetical protein
MSKTIIIVLCVVAVLLAVPLLVPLLRGTQTPSTAAMAATTAPAALQTASGVPVAVTFDPPNGATNVSSSLRELRVTFNVPMGPGCSWCGGGPQFPSTPDGLRPSQSPDHKTCILPVVLEPNHSYALGLNSPSHRNFKSETGIPLVPVAYRFSTGS